MATMRVYFYLFHLDHLALVNTHRVVISIAYNKRRWKKQNNEEKIYIYKNKTKIQSFASFNKINQYDRNRLDIAASSMIESYKRKMGNFLVSAFALESFSKF